MSTVFQGFWHGPPLGPIRSACLSSFVRLGHKFHLYTYDDIAVPSGITIKNAAEIIPIDKIFYFKNLRTASEDIGPFSDLFRFKLLSERGGWWSDVDTVCLSSDVPDFEEAWARENPRHIPNAVGTSQLKLKQDGLVASTLYQKCLKISQSGFAQREALGPRLISTVIGELGLPKDMGGTPETFFPISWIEMFKLWLPEFAEEINSRASGALFMPIYQSFPQYIGIDVGALPPKGSFLYNICAEHSSLQGRIHDPHQVRTAVKQFLASNDWARREFSEYCGPEIAVDFL